MSTIILGIESSCDDTSAAVLQDNILLSNVIASQKVHESYGGVVPELASRAHQQNIVPVVSEAIKRSGLKKEELHAVAYTRGPGLMGSLMVGTSFAKGFSLSLGIPLIDVNHLQAHILAHFIEEKGEKLRAPYDTSVVGDPAEAMRQGGEVAVFEYHNTICKNVANRVKRLQDFARSNDVVIFVGGQKSSNAKVLYNHCLEVNSCTIFVSSITDITAEIMQQCHQAERVGICGATSTPKWLMEECKNKILNN